MSVTRTLDVPLPFQLKRERDEEQMEEDDVDSISSMPLPPLPDSTLITGDDPSDDFLRLTTMVRGVYFSYLHKSLISNYIICCQMKGENAPPPDLKKCAGQMELNAVRASLEASLYRQAMLKMISDVKVHTSHKKVHRKLTTFLHTPPSRIDIGVQTDEIRPLERTRTPDTTFEHAKDAHVQNSSVTSNYDEYVLPTSILATVLNPRTLDERISRLLQPGMTSNRRAAPSRRDSEEVSQSQVVEKLLDIKNEDTVKSIEDFVCLQKKNVSQTDTDIHEIFGDDDAVADVAPGQQENEDSQDSIMQHMEDMFCDSDESSDLMALIEKHSGVSKANIDLEIGKLCPEMSTPIAAPIRNSNKDNTGEPSEIHTNKRKLSFKSYKKMKKHAGAECPEEETKEDRKKRKESGVWLVERIHQVSRLKEKMAEIAVTNYRKHGRIKAKFIELFGEVDDDEMMPDSPVCIEEHLSACKERIAPWVVKYLMPFYKKRRIADRRLFKVVAKHVADMLIIENTFPEENDVNKHIQNYFKNKKTIKTKPDIYI